MNELNFILKMTDQASAVLRSMAGSFGVAGSAAGAAAVAGGKATIALAGVAKAGQEAALAIAGMYTSAKLLKGSEESFMHYDQEIARIGAASGMSAGQMKTFSGEFMKMNLAMKNIPTEQLAGMEVVLARMGVHQADLVSVGTAMAELADSVGQPVEKIAEMSDRVINLTGGTMAMAKQFGDDLSHVAHQSNDLAMRILYLATNMAQGTQQFHVGTRAVLAFSTASANAGLRAELLRSTSLRAFFALQQGSADNTRGFQNFLKVTQLTKQEFDTMLQQHPEQVLLRLADAYQKTVKSGESTSLLKSLGMNSVADRTVLGTWAKQLQQIKTYMDQLNSGQSNGDLDKRFAIVNDTQLANVKGLGKEWDALKISIGGALEPLVGPGLTAATRMLQGLTSGFQSLPGPIQTVVASVLTIGPMLVSASLGVLAIKTALSSISVARALINGGPATVAAGAAVGEETGVVLGATAGTGMVAGILTRLRGAKPALVAEGAVEGAVTGEALGVAAGTTAGIGIKGALMKVGWIGIGLAIATELGRAIGSGVGSYVNEHFKDTAQSIANWRDNSTIGKGIFHNSAMNYLGLDPASVQARNAGNQAGPPPEALSTTGGVNQNGQAVDTTPPGGSPKLGVEGPPKPGHNKKTIDDTVKSLQEELQVAQAITGDAKISAEVHKQIATAAESMHISYEAAASKIGGLVSAIQEAKKATAVRGAADGYDDEAAKSAALTHEQEQQVTLAMKLRDIAKEHGTLTAQQVALVTAAADKADDASRLKALDEIDRSLMDQIKDMRAVGQGAKDQLDVVKQINDFERAHGQLLDEDRAATEKLILAQKQLAEAQQLQGKLDPTVAAKTEYASQLATLDLLKQRGTITDEYYAQLKKTLDLQSQKGTDPVGEYVRSQKDAIAALSDGKGDAKQFAEAQKEINQLITEGVNVTPQLTKDIQDYTKAMAEAEKAKKTGFSGWAEGVPELKDALNGVAKDFSGNVATALQSAIEGKRGSITNLMRSLSQDLIKTGTNDLLKKGGNLLGLNKPATDAEKKAKDALGRIQKDGSMQTAHATITATNVTVSGKVTSGGANDNKVGGIGPGANDNAAAGGSADPSIDTFAADGSPTPATGGSAAASTNMKSAASALDQIGASALKAVPGLGQFGGQIMSLATSLLGGGGGGGGAGGIMSLASLFAADGGKVSGPGTGRSDSVLAAVSHGEFIMNADSTKKWEPLLHAMNNNKMMKFADGGMVGGFSPSLSLGESSLINTGQQDGGTNVVALGAHLQSLSSAVSKLASTPRGGNTNNVNMTVNAKDAGSFRQSKGQIAAAGQAAQGRAHQRNN